MSFLDKLNLQNFFGLSDDEYDDYEDFSVAPQRPMVSHHQKKEVERVQMKATRTPQPRTIPQQQMPPKVNQQKANFERPKPQRQPQTQKLYSQERASENVLKKMPQPVSGHMKIAIKDPRVYSESKEIGKLLISGEAVLVNFHLMEEEAAKRVIDFLTGIVFAVSGDIQRVGNEIFLCTPQNIEIDGETTRSLLSDYNFDF